MAIIEDHHQLLMQEPGAPLLTFDGKLALAGVASQTERDVWFPSLGGARVRVKVPERWDFRSISAHALFEHRRGRPMGFQRHPRGSGLMQLLGEPDRVYPDNLVSIGGGTLAHYRLDYGSEAVGGFTLWQGRWSDVFTFDHDTFEEALAAFRRFLPHETSHGAVLERPRDWKLSEESATIDCGTLVLNVYKREEGTSPPWQGAEGVHVELYRGTGDEGSDERVLAVSPSAVAEVGRDTGHDAVTDSEVAEMAEGLDLVWD